MNWKNEGKRQISLFLFSILMLTSGFVLWQFVSFMMDLQDILDWMASFEVR